MNITGILKYEFIKLTKKKFLILTALLLTANLLVLYIYEKHTAVYFYIYEQKENYAAYLQGNAEADTDGFYSQDRDAQESYIAAYPSFVNGMEERVEKMAGISLYSDPASYAYRNLIKTKEDFSAFSDITLQADNCFGIRELANYNGSSLFLLLFLIILAYYVLFQERGQKLILLLKCNKNGHFPLAAAKLAVMLAAALFYTVIQECSTFLLLDILYGYGSVNRMLQSVSIFRNCSLHLTVEQGLLVTLFVRSLSALILTSILYCIGMLIKNETAAVFVVAAVAGGEYFAARLFSINGSLSWLKCINPFYYWNMKCMLGEYHNLNFFGRPLSRDVCAFTVGIAALLLFSAAGILAFQKKYQVREEGRLEALMQWLRKKTGFLNRHLSLLYYEFYKIMVQQKKGIAVALLAAWGIYEAVSVFGTEYYATTKEAAYHYYIDLLKGPVTEDTFTYMEQEEARLEGLWTEMASLKKGSGADYVKQLQIQTELTRLEEGFDMVRTQLEQLTQKKGGLAEKYLIDELSYKALWQDVERELMLWLISSVAIMFLVSGIYTLDFQKGMQPLLRSARYGRKRLDFVRNTCALLCTGFILLTAELPLFLQYYKIDGFAAASQSLDDFTMVSCSGSASLGLVITGIFLCKAISLFIVCLIGLKLSKTMKSEIPAFWQASALQPRFHCSVINSDGISAYF